MGGPPITFPTPNFLIRLPLRKIDFYATLPAIFMAVATLATLTEAQVQFPK